MRSSKRKSKTRKPKPWEKPELAREYRELNQRCEAFPLVGPALGMRDLPTWPPTAVHHIWHRAYRLDSWANLITLCGTMHGLAHGKYESELRVACMLVKARKSELDWDVWDEAGGQCVIAWLERLPTLGAPWDGYKAELLEGTDA